MTLEERDKAILLRILDWCGQIEEAHIRFGHSRKAFFEVSLYRNGTSMCLFQICELSGRLSDGFRAEHSEMPWQQIRGMRNLFAHDYGNMDNAGIWETLCNDIPVIERFCMEQTERSTHDENRNPREGSEREGERFEN